MKSTKNNKTLSVLNRREFIGSMTAIGTAGALSNSVASENLQPTKQIIKPQRLQKGDLVGIITPASPPFEPSIIQEGKAMIEYLGFKTRLGKNIGKKYGYLAGTDAERLADLHEMFLDDDVRAIITLRGGYGSGRLLDQIDYELIRNHPKILIGYSDITSLHLAIHKMTGLVAFHGPVALSTFNTYSTKYFLKILTSTEPIGEIETPPLKPTEKYNGIFPIRSGIASGALIGGNLMMTAATLGTPYEIDTTGKIIFFEEVGEEPYDLDRLLTQLKYAKKFEGAAGIIIDKCARCGPKEYKPGFENSLSVEEVFLDRLSDVKCPVLFGLSLGHVANKPTLPLGIQATMNTETGQIQIDEAAVI